MGAVGSGSQTGHRASTQLVEGRAGLPEEKREGRERIGPVSPFLGIFRDSRVVLMPV